MVQIAGGSTDFGSGYKGLIPADLSSLGINLLTGGENLATCTITASGGGGAGFACTCTITGGVVTLVTVTNAGSGYVSIPTPVITTTAIPDTTKVDPTVEFTIGFPVFTTLPNPDTVDPLTLPQGLGTCYMWIYRNDGTGGLVNKNDEPTIMEKAFCVYQNPYDGGFQPMFEGGRFYSHGYVTLTDNTGASVKAWIISFR
jgi:hypothetical protein